MHMNVATGEDQDFVESRHVGDAGGGEKNEGPSLNVN